MKLIIPVVTFAAAVLMLPTHADAQQPPVRRGEQARARQAFIRADVNKDGALSPQEFQRALRIYRLQLRRALIRANRLPRR